MSKMQKLKDAHPKLFDSRNWDHQTGFGLVDLKTNEVGYFFRFKSKAEKARFELYLFNNNLRHFDGYRLVPELQTKYELRKNDR